MTESINDSVHNDELYKKMQEHFQRAEWQEGLDILSDLIEKYPLEPELWPLMNDMSVRANIDQDERSERRAAAVKRFRKIAFRVSIAAVLIVAFTWFVSSYIGDFEVEAAKMREELNREIEQKELKSKKSTALTYLANYRPDEAEELLDEIMDTDPQYPGLIEAYEIVAWQQSLNEKYDEAVARELAGDFNEALLIFQAVEVSQPSYRDVVSHIQDIQREFSLNDYITKARNAISMGDWEGAIENLEAVRSLDFYYQQTDVEDMLFLSYMNSARDLLDQEPASVDMLLQARDYYNKAKPFRPQDISIYEEIRIAEESVAERLFTQYMELAQDCIKDQADSLKAIRCANDYYEEAKKIRPDDTRVLREQTLAGKFLKAQIDVSNKHWSPAISELVDIYEQDSDYASGTATQMLYDAYIQRGDNFLFVGKAMSALEDYQQAVAISEYNPDSLLRRFEVQTRIGDVYGVIGNYENAIYQYRTALEMANIHESMILDPEIVESLEKADTYVSRKRFESAYPLYNAAIEKIAENFQTIIHEVESGDYLVQLARFYQTTLSAIMEANNISDPDDISIGDRIKMPVIP